MLFSSVLIVHIGFRCEYCVCRQGMDDVQVRGAATDIFSYLVEYNPSMVREFIMQESQQNDDVSTALLPAHLPHAVGQQR